MSRGAIVFASLMVLAGCEQSASTTAPDLQAPFERSASAPVLKVTMGGKLDLSEFNLPDETYAMVAMKDADGNVSGNIRVRLSDPLLDFHGDITCLQVQDNLVWIGVVVTKSSVTSGSYAEGGSFWFRVQDNGEGSAAPIDRISSLNPAGGAARCNERRTGLQLAWTLHGNVEIH